MAEKFFMAILGCDMVTSGDCLRRSVLVFPMEMALAFWSDGWNGFFLMGRNIGTPSKRNGAI